MHVSGRKLPGSFKKFANESAMKSTHAELKAVTAERDCNGFYSAEFMTPFIGQEFDGTITGLTEISVFVMLGNTVEGRVSFRELSDNMSLENGVTLSNKITGAKFTLGDKVRVKCVACSVPMGTVDFEIQD
jgi:ribonuclease R